MRGEGRNRSGKVLAAESGGAQVFFPFFPNKEAFLEAPEEDRGLGMKPCDCQALRACPESGAQSREPGALQESGVEGSSPPGQADGSLAPHRGLLPSVGGSGG